jgi:TolB protein
MLNKRSLRPLISLLLLFSLSCSLLATPNQSGGPPAATRPGISAPATVPAGTASPDPGPQLPSPPGTARIVFVATGWSVKAAGNEIFVMNPDGSGITSITNSPGDDIEPAWSADGRKIAFTSKRDGHFEIYWMNADGSRQTRLTDSPEDKHYPAWSPDGEKIAFATVENGQSDLFVINVDGTGLARLTNSSDANERYPDWSPDGKQMLFSSFGGKDSGIYRMNADGSKIKLILAGPLHHPKWSPDGKKIAFDGEPAGCKFEIYVMNADGSGLSQVTNHPKGCGGYNKHPGWSPDGKALVYYSSDRNPPSAPNSPNIYATLLDGRVESALTNGVTALNSGGYDPAWSPIP